MIKASAEVTRDSGLGSTDIAFLLIIFFMVSISAVVNTGLGMKLAKPDPQKNEEIEQVLKDDVIDITLLGDGGYTINDKKAEDLKGLAPLLQREIERISKPKTSVTVADARTYGDLLAVLDMGRDLGLEAFSIRGLTTDFSWGLKIKKLLVENKAENKASL